MDNLPPDALVAHVAELIHTTDALLIGAGAGMSVDSGLPDFRGREGFWRAYPPAKALGLDFHDLASPETFRRDPRLAWGFYGHRLNLYRNTAPHAGYGILLRWCERIRKRGGSAAVFTSNVDGHFQVAGFPDDDGSFPLVECHGSIHRWQCSVQCGSLTWPAGSIDVDVLSLRAEGELPTCPSCGALARPNLLMFDDDAWIAHAVEIQEQFLKAWWSATRGRTGLALEIGAGSAIPTVRQTCRGSALRFRCESNQVVRINPESVGNGAQVIHLRGGALATLRAIDKRLQATAP